MKYWNYRVIRDPRADAQLAVHEVYYDDEDKPVSWTEHPVSPIAGSAEGLERELSAMKAALSRPWLRIVYDTPVRLVDDSAPAVSEN